LPEPVRLETQARELRRDADVWQIALSGPDGEQWIRARRVILATPAYATAGLLAAADPEAAKVLAGIEYAPIVAVALGVDPAEIRGEVEGFGFIVPRSAGTRLLGCLFMSRLFPGRAPEGRELLHCMLGGTRWPEAVQLPDELLIEQLVADLDRSLGLEAAPRTLCVRRFDRAIPQPGVDHLKRVDEVTRRVAALPGLGLAGSYLAGVSVADSLASGVCAAARVTQP
jgi:oxygen-dependent protoporphyrinogen oxidase